MCDGMVSLFGPRREEFLASDGSLERDYAGGLVSKWIEKSPKGGIALFISGELSDMRIVPAIEKLLASGYSVGMVFGPVVEERSKEKLIELKKIHGERFQLSQQSERLEHHAIRVNNN